MDVTAIKEGRALQNDALLSGVPERVQGRAQALMQVEKTTDVKQAAWGSREEVDRQTEQIYWEGTPSPTHTP